MLSDIILKNLLFHFRVYKSLKRRTCFKCHHDTFVKDVLLPLRVSVEGGKANDPKQ